MAAFESGGSPPAAKRESIGDRASMMDGLIRMKEEHTERKLIREWAKQREDDLRYNEALAEEERAAREETRRDGFANLKATMRQVEEQAEAAALVDGCAKRGEAVGARRRASLQGGGSIRSTTSGATISTSRVPWVGSRRRPRPALVDARAERGEAVGARRRASQGGRWIRSTTSGGTISTSRAPWARSRRRPRPWRWSTRVLSGRSSWRRASRRRRRFARRRAARPFRHQERRGPGRDGGRGRRWSMPCRAGEAVGVGAASLQGALDSPGTTSARPFRPSKAAMGRVETEAAAVALGRARRAGEEGCTRPARRQSDARRA